MRLRTLCFLSVAVVLVGQAVPAQAQIRKREMAQEGERAVCVLHSVGKSGVTRHHLLSAGRQSHSCHR